MKNPYSKLINHMREQGAKYNTPYVQIGIVVSEDPLTVKLGDLQISKDNLLVADYLLPDYKRKYSASGNLQFSENGSLGPTDSASVGDHGSHSHTLTGINIDTDHKQSGDLTLTDGLKKDDTVALIPTLDEQTYIILARLVSL
ncbi:hypothetical protein DEAC_c14300 [Desulfosporosinus acididurans]|uniref:DUF2577 domain-containing protein n=1 Tax=Desulfosporosinus acididurans TaxID=476652 RepID=A0A0J1FTY8_9FIRM|nr:DUF2577 domain-containing protein [Desulfosporosinus acididurans]KLU66762.1 hypothetical protein DEAC_c14300 [Desulfosporosinus acididurans]